MKVVENGWFWFENGCVTVSVSRFLSLFVYSVALVISISVCAGSKVSENARKRLVVAVGLENGCLQGNQRTKES